MSRGIAGHSGMFPQLMKSAGCGRAKPDLLRRNEGEESEELPTESEKMAPVLRKFAGKWLLIELPRRDSERRAFSHA